MPQATTPSARTLLVSAGVAEGKAAATGPHGAVQAAPGRCRIATAARMLCALCALRVSRCASIDCIEQPGSGGGTCFESAGTALFSRVAALQQQQPSDAFPRSAPHPSPPEPQPSTIPTTSATGEPSENVDLALVAARLSTAGIKVHHAGRRWASARLGSTCNRPSVDALVASMHVPSQMQAAIVANRSVPRPASCTDPGHCHFCGRKPAGCNRRRKLPGLL